MKKFALLLSALLVTGAAYASQANAPAKTKEPAKSSATMKTHTVEAEVVSADATAKTLTIKGDKGEQTVPVEGAAVSELKNVKAGETVKLTCRDNAAGEHQAITKIHAEKSSSSTAKTPKK
jgi:FtsP/CotA-like multicopper oxidase with cupredoxin domain